MGPPDDRNEDPSSLLCVRCLGGVPLVLRSRSLGPCVGFGEQDQQGRSMTWHSGWKPILGRRLPLGADPGLGTSGGPVCTVQGSGVWKESRFQEQMPQTPARGQVENKWWPAGALRSDCAVAQGVDCAGPRGPPASPLSMLMRMRAFPLKAGLLCAHACWGSTPTCSPKPSGPAAEGEVLCLLLVWVN